MALDSFFHNKIEALELEIIERNAKLRRLEAQRNDLNSRGRMAGGGQGMILTDMQCGYYERNSVSCNSQAPMSVKSSRLWAARGCLSRSTRRANTVCGLRVCSRGMSNGYPQSSISVMASTFQNSLPASVLPSFPIPIASIASSPAPSIPWCLS